MSYKTIRELYQAACQEKKEAWEIILRAEAELGGLPEKAILDEIKKRYDIMRRSALAMLPAGQKPFRETMISGMASRQEAYRKRADRDGAGEAEGTICGSQVNEAMARALSASEMNASMGRICAAPTAGACGILPAVLTTLQDAHGFSDEQMVQALLLASGVGAVITANATVSGAEGGCQAECGVAAAMAAAAAVFLKEGTYRQQQDALSFALINCMGLICDPIAGLVQIPCAQRNASQAVNAMLSADLALAGQECPIPADEVISAMYHTGRLMSPLLKETAMGGIAATETGRTFKEVKRDGSL